MKRLELISSTEYVQVMFEASALNMKSRGELMERVLALQKELVENIPVPDAGDGWVKVSERLPEVGLIKPAGMEWIVTDGGQIWIEKLRPCYWNSYGMLKITHWREQLTPPKQ